MSQAPVALAAASSLTAVSPVPEAESFSPVATRALAARLADLQPAALLAAHLRAAVSLPAHQQAAERPVAASQVVALFPAAALAVQAADSTPRGMSRRCRTPRLTFQYQTPPQTTSRICR
jgi:hypothetical protein